MFWQYDTRLGSRWNVDSVDQISISNYATLGITQFTLQTHSGMKKEIFIKVLTIKQVKRCILS